MGALKGPLLPTSLLRKMGCMQLSRLHAWKILDLSMIACLEGGLFILSQDPKQRYLCYEVYANLRASFMK